MGDIFNFSSFDSVMGDNIVVICVIGVRFNFDFIGLYKVDYLGIKNLVDAVKKKGIEYFVLVFFFCVF